MPRPGTRLAAAMALAIVLAACAPAATSGPPATPAGPTATTSAGPIVPPSPSPIPTPADPTAVYGLVASQIEQIRGLEPTSAVAPVLIDQAQLSANLATDFDKSNPPSVIENSQRELIGLGLLPAGTSLRTAVLALQSGQVAGYYSPKQNELFVVSKAGGIGALQRLTYAHEFTHQLQDQHFDLDKLGLQAPDEGDRSLARLAMVEGDAVSTQYTWMQTALTAEELGEVLAASLDPAGIAALNGAPVVLQQTALFPYTTGLQFAQALLASGGYDAVNRAFAAPPDSTEQVIHPEKYVAHEPPIVVKPAADLAAKLGSGWSEAARDTLGEFMLRVWLHEGAVSAGEADLAAAGWGGDRLVLFVGPGGATALAIETSWDTAADADEFASAATTAIAGLHLHGAIAHGAGSSKVSIAIGPDDATAEVLGSALPR